MGAKRHTAIALRVLLPGITGGVAVHVGGVQAMLWMFVGAVLLGVMVILRRWDGS